MATKNCKHIFGLHVSGADNKPSKRVTWCCDLRHGFMVKHWRCVGLGHADCPLTAQQSVHSDAGESAASSGIIQTSAESKTKTEPTPTQRR